MIVPFLIDFLVIQWIVHNTGVDHVNTKDINANSLDGQFGKSSSE